MAKKLTKLIYCFVIILNHFAYAEYIETIGVKVEKLKSIELYDSYEYIGIAKASPSKDFYAHQAGVIDFIIPSDKDKVKNGDVLIQINKNYAESYRKETELAYQNAKDLLNDAEKLYNKNYTSEADFNNKKLSALTASKNLKLMQTIYDDLIIKAPFDGLVGAIPNQIGDNITIGDYLFSVIGSADKEFIFQLPEVLLSKVDLDTEIFVSIQDQDKYFQAKITNISPYLNPKANNFTTKATLKDAPQFPHNSLVRGKILLNKHQGLAVKETSILQNENGHFIFLVTKEKKVKKIYVKTLSRLDDFIEIESKEIKEGDLIVTNGLNKILDGSLVNIIEN